MSNDKAAATYGQVAAPHEFHWNSDIPGPGTCTCGRRLDHPLHLRGETTGDHTQTKLDDNPYGLVSTEEALPGMAFLVSQLGQHTGSTIPGVPQNQYLRDMAKKPEPHPGVWYVPFFGWPVTRGPAKTYEWYLGASVIVAILILFAFVRIFYIG